MPPVSTERLHLLLAPIVEAVGLDLEEIKIRKAGSRSVVSVVVDKDGGVDLDTVAVVSRACSDALDENDPFGSQPYVLEVGSPGVDRPLTEPRHWRRARNRLVHVTFMDGSTTTGRIVEIADDRVQLLDDSGVRVVEFADVSKAVVQVEFNSSGSGDSDAAAGAADQQGE